MQRMSGATGVNQPAQQTRPADTTPSTPTPATDETTAAEAPNAADAGALQTDAGEAAVRTTGGSRGPEVAEPEDQADIHFDGPQDNPAAPQESAGAGADGSQTATSNWKPPSRGELTFGGQSGQGSGAEETSENAATKARAKAQEAELLQQEELAAQDAAGTDIDDEVAGAEHRAGEVAREKAHMSLEQNEAVHHNAEHHALQIGTKIGRKQITGARPVVHHHHDPVQEGDTGKLIEEAHAAGLHSPGVKEKEDEERKAENERKAAEQRRGAGDGQAQLGTGGPAPPKTSEGQPEVASVDGVDGGDRVTARQVTPQEEVAQRFREFKVGEEKTPAEHAALAQQGLSLETAQAARNIAEGQIPRKDDPASNIKHPDPDDSTRAMELARVGKTNTVAVGDRVEHPIQHVLDDGVLAQPLEPGVEVGAGGQDLSGVRYADAGLAGNVETPVSRAWQAAWDGTPEVIGEGLVQHEGTIGGASVRAWIEGLWNNLQMANFETANGLGVNVQSQYQPGTGLYNSDISFRDRSNNVLRHRSDSTGASAWSKNDEPVSEGDAQDFLWASKPPIVPKSLFPMLGALAPGVNSQPMQNFLSQQDMTAQNPPPAEAVKPPPSSGGQGTTRATPPALAGAPTSTQAGAQHLLSAPPAQPGAQHLLSAPPRSTQVAKAVAQTDPKAVAARAYGSVQGEGVKLFAADTPARTGWYPLLSEETAHKNFSSSLGYVRTDHSENPALTDKERGQLAEARTWVNGALADAKKKALAEVGSESSPDFSSTTVMHLTDFLQSPTARQQVGDNPALQNLTVRARQLLDSGQDYGAALDDLEQKMPTLSGAALATNVRQQEMMRQQLLRAGQTAPQSGTVQERFTRMADMTNFYCTAQGGPTCTAEQTETQKYFQHVAEYMTSPDRLAAAGLHTDANGQLDAEGQRGLQAQFIRHVASLSTDARAASNPGFANMVLLAQSVLDADQRALAA